MLRRYFKKVAPLYTPPEDFNILKGYIRLHNMHAVQTWSPHLRKNIDCLQRIRSYKMVFFSPVLSNPKSGVFQRGFFSPYQRGDLIEMYEILTSHENLDPANFFKRTCSDHDLRGHSLKLFKARTYVRFRLT